MNKNNYDSANLLYTYDQKTGHIGAVPASPLLLPFLMLWSLYAACKALANWLKFRALSKPENIFETRGVSPERYYRDRDRYIALVDKEKRTGLTFNEQRTLWHLRHPDWLKPGEPPIRYK